MAYLPISDGLLQGKEKIVTGEMLAHEDPIVELGSSELFRGIMFAHLKFQWDEACVPRWDDGRI